VLPGTLCIPSTFVRGEGLGYGRRVTLPHRVIAAANNELPEDLDFEVRFSPDRTSVDVVTCDALGNPLQYGGNTVTATLRRRHPRPPSRSSSIASESEDDEDDDLEFLDEEERKQRAAEREQRRLDLLASTAGGRKYDDSVDDDGSGWFEEGRMCNLKIKDNDDGTYTVEYTVRTTGVFELLVRLLPHSMPRRPSRYCTRSTSRLCVIV
jgi:hypothetical protein